MLEGSGVTDLRLLQLVRRFVEYHVNSCHGHRGCSVTEGTFVLHDNAKTNMPTCGCCKTSGMPSRFMPTPVTIIVGPCAGFFNCAPYRTRAPNCLKAPGCTGAPIPTCGYCKNIRDVVPVQNAVRTFAPRLENRESTMASTANWRTHQQKTSVPLVSKPYTHAQMVAFMGSKRGGSLQNLEKPKIVFKRSASITRNAKSCDLLPKFSAVEFAEDPLRKIFS